MALPSNGQHALRTLLQRRAQLEEDLKSTEKQIFDMEENYIDDTHHYGNVIKGWEGFLNAKPKQQHMRKTKIIEKDRIFSGSSATCPKVRHSLTCLASRWLFQAFSSLARSVS
jgi:chromatin modification-related protein EAF6